MLRVPFFLEKILFRVDVYIYIVDEKDIITLRNMFTLIDHLFHISTNKVL